MLEQRYIKSAVTEFLQKRMVFIGGPRQVGKTTLCLSFLNPPLPTNPAYLNWDSIHDKSRIRKGEIPSAGTLVFDEIHKFSGWRNLIKGFFDKKRPSQKFLVTGSARLDYYRRGGDSLLGRYRYLRLHPFSIGELGAKTSSDIDQLLRLGGFPAPFLSGSEREWKLWNRERLHRVVSDDIRDLENVRDLSKLEILAETLPSRVGSPLSVRNLAEDLEVSPKTLELWISILERVYYCFRISPYGAPKIRAVKKEKKLYLWDWSSIEDSGARYENFVASHLLKYCHFMEDTEGDSFELRFLRDTDKREVDFVVLKNKKPLFAVESKTGEKSLSPAIRYFKERTSIPEFYQVHSGNLDFEPENGIRVMPFSKFCIDKKI